MSDIPSLNVLLLDIVIQQMNRRMITSALIRATLFFPGLVPSPNSSIKTLHHLLSYSAGILL